MNPLPCRVGGGRTGQALAQEEEPQRRYGIADIDRAIEVRVSPEKRQGRMEALLTDPELVDELAV